MKHLKLRIVESDTMVRGCSAHGSLGLQRTNRSHDDRGRGAVLSYSWKQKTNTKSSTETELVGVNDAISNIL
jgi:hypothetical protein